jgi:hypothetical protein
MIGYWIVTIGVVCNYGIIVDYHDEIVLFQIAFKEKP